METAIRWSSRSTPSEPRFLIIDVVGKTFKHCQVTSYKRGRFQWEELSRNTKVPAFRAFDWSPSDNIVAIGQWSGETSILGLESGSRLISLPIKSQRQCNAVAFGPNGLLATGLERVRNDFCLNVYDINHRLSGRAIQSAEAKSHPVEPIRKLATSEGITSIKFFIKQPNSVLTGVKGTCVRIYDLRDNSGIPALQYQTSCVHNLAIDPTDENYFASAGPPKDTTVLVWDRRSNVRPIIGRNNPMIGNDLSEGPVLEPKGPFESEDKADHASIWSLRYSSTESGCLGVLSSNGHFRTYRTKKDYVDVDSEPRHPTEQTLSQSSQALYVNHIDTIERSYLYRQGTTKQKRQDEFDRVVSFDFLNLFSTQHKPCAITLRGNQEVGICELKGRPPALTISVKNTLAITSPDRHSFAQTNPKDGPTGLLILRPSHSSPTSDGLLEIGETSERLSSKKNTNNYLRVERSRYHNKNLGPAKYPNHGAGEERDDTEDSLQLPEILSIYEALRLSDIDRYRCAAGYQFDCAKNLKIVKSEPALRTLWRWVEVAQRNSSYGMVARKTDFSFLGVHGIWTNNLGRNRETRELSEKPVGCDVSEAIIELATTLELPSMAFPSTSKKGNRLLSLYTCGFAMDPQRLSARIEQLVESKQNTEACLLALLLDRNDLSYKALRSGPQKDELRELSMIITTFTESKITETGREQVREMMVGQCDSFIQAISTYVTTSDWKQILEIPALPLQYKIVAALKCLDDDSFSTKIDKWTHDAISTGALDGVFLTGLNDIAFDLFEKYIERTNDVQTAALALSFAAPRYVWDARFFAWREYYRDQMNRWLLFLKRAKFDMQSTKLSTTWDGTVIIKPIDRQVVLRCDNCNQPYQRIPIEEVPRTEDYIRASAHGSSILGDARSGTVCPKCNAHLPRCVICEQWLGMPDPHSRGGAVSSKKDPFNGHMECCVECAHSYHRGHASEWFAKHDKCPAPDCDCKCNQLGTVRFGVVNERIE